MAGLTRAPKGDCDYSFAKRQLPADREGWLRSQPAFAPLANAPGEHAPRRR